MLEHNSRVKLKWHINWLMDIMININTSWKHYENSQEFQA